MRPGGSAPGRSESRVTLSSDARLTARLQNRQSDVVSTIHLGRDIDEGDGMPGRSIAAIDHVLEVAHLFNTTSRGWVSEGGKKRSQR